MYFICFCCRFSSCVALSFFFFKHRTAYVLRISGGSSYVCSSDLASVGCSGGCVAFGGGFPARFLGEGEGAHQCRRHLRRRGLLRRRQLKLLELLLRLQGKGLGAQGGDARVGEGADAGKTLVGGRSEERRVGNGGVSKMRLRVEREY